MLLSPWERSDLTVQDYALCTARGCVPNPANCHCTPPPMSMPTRPPPPPRCRRFDGAVKLKAISIIGGGAGSAPARMKA